MGSEMMDHSQHMAMTSDSISHGGTASTDCCPDCECSMGGCSSAVVLVSQSIFSPNASQLLSSYSASLDNQVRIALFRPPISR